MKIRILIIGLLCLFVSGAIRANDDHRTDANLVGHVVDKSNGEHLPFVSVSLVGTTIVGMTDVTGHFSLVDLPVGDFTLRASSPGYKPEEVKVTLSKNKTEEIKFELLPDMIELDNVVVTANRSETAHRNAPGLVNVISSKLFEQTNSCTLSQGIVFQPGVRVENNCQNCGTTQVRLNGLDGQYSQILINSRPIFSALAGVYGLEQIPANMIDRVEVVRGGGSALFGSSAIAGTINIITKEPLRNSGFISHSISNFDGSSSFDNNTNMNLSLVTNDNKLGVYLYGQSRQRSAWDKNGDGFSELPKLQNQMIGLNGFYRISPYTKLNIEYHHMNEFRRGGCRLDLPPHIAVDHRFNGMGGDDGIVEQIEHSIDAGGLNLLGFSKNHLHSYKVYASAQNINRKSYYGGYGKTTDVTAVAGGQYVYHFNKLFFMPSDLTLGAEYNHDKMKDNAIDYLSFYTQAEESLPEGATTEEILAKMKDFIPEPLNQTVNITSAFFQNEWKNEAWSILVGGRVDKNSIMDKAIFSPRVNLRYNPTRNMSIRFSYAEGFRAPQAFDEDLHTGTVGGDRVFFKRAKDLKEERSHSLDLSFDAYKHFNNGWQGNVLVEGFYTALVNPFMMTPPVDVEGSPWKESTRVNTSGAKVYGGTIEAKLAFQKLFQAQVGLTVQRSVYDKAEQWSDDEKLSENERYSKNMRRTPNIYGYFTASYTPIKSLTLALNGNYTGKMYVAHHLSGIDENLTDELVHTPSFFELGLKLSYNFNISRIQSMWSVGVSNLFNSYQKDFDKGSTREAEYVYGPGAPRTYYTKLSFSF